MTGASGPRGSVAFLPSGQAIRVPVRLVGTKVCCGEDDCGARPLTIGSRLASGHGAGPWSQASSEGSTEEGADR